MIEYIKNAKAYKLQNKHISSRCGPGYMTQFLEKWVKGQGHRSTSRLVQYTIKLLYKPWAKSMGEGDFWPSTARRPLDQFSWNWKYITTSRTRPRMQNFRGLYRRGWSGQIASLTHESFCPFFRLFATPTGRIFGHIPTLNTSLCVVSAKVVPFGG